MVTLKSDSHMIGPSYLKPDSINMENKTSITPPASSPLPNLSHLPQVQVDGNIGSGKSTFIDALTKFISDPHTGLSKLKTIPEPVAHWQSICDSQGDNILKKFYKTPKDVACIIQLYALITRSMESRKAYMSLPTDNSLLAFISERGIDTDCNVFAQNAYESGLMSELEFKIYQDVFTSLPKLLSFNSQPDLRIYIRATPEISHQRIQKRNRVEEKDKVSLAYLEQLHKKHEEWLACTSSSCVTGKDSKSNLGVAAKLCKTIVIDADKNYFEDKGALNQLLGTIKAEIEEVALRKQGACRFLGIKVEDHVHVYNQEKDRA